MGLLLVMIGLYVTLGAMVMFGRGPLEAFFLRLDKMMDENEEQFGRYKKTGAVFALIVIGLVAVIIAMLCGVIFLGLFKLLLWLI